MFIKAWEDMLNDWSTDDDNLYDQSTFLFAYDIFTSAFNDIIFFSLGDNLNLSLKEKNNIKRSKQRMDDVKNEIQTQLEMDTTTRTKKFEILVRKLQTIKEKVAFKSTNNADVTKLDMFNNMYTEDDKNLLVLIKESIGEYKTQSDEAQQTTVNSLETLKAVTDTSTNK